MIGWRKGGHGAALGQGWEEVLSEGEKAVELWGNGEVTADAGVALEVVDLGDFGGAEEVDDGRGGVGAGVGVGIGFGEESVEDGAGEGLQGEGDEQEGVFAPEAHFEGAFGVGGVIDFAVAEGDEGLPDDTAVGEAFFDDEDAGGHCDGFMLTRTNRNATETMRGWGERKGGALGSRLPGPKAAAGCRSPRWGHSGNCAYRRLTRKLRKATGSL
jgi:hypothetical protein